MRHVDMAEGPKAASLQLPALVAFDCTVRTAPRCIGDGGEHLEACSTVDAFVDRAAQDACKPKSSAALVVDEVITDEAPITPRRSLQEIPDLVLKQDCHRLALKP